MFKRMCAHLMSDRSRHFKNSILLNLDIKYQKQKGASCFRFYKQQRKMKKPLVTVVVPVYNTGKYIDRCLKSIVNQTYKNLEIILVDDGSTDNSSLLCDEWKKKDKRIIAVHKKNAGLGMARNSGIEYATGEYVSFVDSDDFVDLDIYELLVRNIEKSNADTSYCSLKQYSNKTKKIRDFPQPRVGVFSGKEVLYDILGAPPEEKDDYKKEMSVCAVLFSTKIIKDNHISFVSEREFICEDLIFDFQYLSCAQKVVVSEETKYYYCVNDNSLTHKYNPKRFEQDIILYKKVLELINETFDNKEVVILRFNKLLLGLIRVCFVQEVKNSNCNIEEKKKRLNKMASNEVVQGVLSNYPYSQNHIKQRIFNMLLRGKHTILIYIICALK